MEARRETVKRIDAMTVKVTRVSGRVLVIGTGEVTVDVPFPVNFIERPVFNFGGELDENHRATAGKYPTISAVVTTWTKVKEVVGSTDGYYTGASVAVVTSGQTGQQLWLHYSFEAKAVSNPLNSLENTNDTI